MAMSFFNWGICGGHGVLLLSLSPLEKTELSLVVIDSIKNQQGKI